jgi:AcrR family transcriptional regulator
VSGVTSTSICLHFADKDALPDAVCAGYFEKLDAEMQPWCQDRLPHEGARRASICSWMSGDIGVDAVDPAEHVRGQELVMVGGETRWSDSIYCCF